MSPLQWIRNKMISMTNKFLPSRGRLFLLEKGGCEVTLDPVSIKQRKYLFWFIPLYEIESDDMSKFSLTNDLVNPLTRISRSLNSLVGLIPSMTWKITIKNILTRLYQGINLIRDESNARFTASYGSIHKKFLRDALSKNQNVFRQKLSDAIKTTTSEFLSNSIRKHLGTLLIKMREEENKQYNQNCFSSGPMALPANCKFVFKKGKASVFIIEQTPQVRTISYLGKRFRIALPYVIFAVTVHQGKIYCLQVFFRTSPLQSEDNELLCPALPNVHKDYVACFPAPQGENFNLNQLVDESIQNYWGSNFNKDLRGFIDSASSQFYQLNTFEGWEQHSKDDPQFVLSLAWQSARTDILRLADDRLNIALDNNNGNSGKSSAEVLSEYAGILGEKFSREVAEKLHFIVNHSHIDVDSLALANEQFSKLMEADLQKLITEVEASLVTPFSKNDIEAAVQELQGELGKEVNKIYSSDIANAISRAKSLQRKG